MLWRKTGYFDNKKSLKDTVAIALQLNLLVLKSWNKRRKNLSTTKEPRFFFGQQTASSKNDLQHWMSHNLWGESLYTFDIFPTHTVKYTTAKKKAQ